VAESDQGFNDFDVAMSGSHHQGRVTGRGLSFAELLNAVELGSDSVNEFEVALGAGHHKTLGLLFNHDGGRGNGYYRVLGGRVVKVGGSTVL
jgi:hypothetical protein